MKIARKTMAENKLQYISSEIVTRAKVLWKIVTFQSIIAIYNSRRGAVVAGLITMQRVDKLLSLYLSSKDNTAALEEYILNNIELETVEQVLKHFERGPKLTIEFREMYEDSSTRDYSLKEK